MSSDAEMVNNSKVSTECKGLIECGNKYQARQGGEVEWAGASGCMQWENGTEVLVWFCA